ncbi:PREDICTED: uncharacterized protein LOC107162969 [Diuraphis noxia]|uniref:uncharacterized protein LOC107162969 n=1 Tax=Diuraphis noxia TaxID=143948 RepID=UPI0007638F17|nr:PREDICTED: uncharacterized protein LOC107162969 [Diuraphis noxia]
MDSNETFHGKDSSKTIILWKNEIPLEKCASVSLLENLYQHDGHLCKVPTGISEHFSNSVIKTCENFVNGVIAYSKQAVQCYLRRNKLEYSNPADYNSENIMINMNAVQACKDGANLDSNNYSLFSNPSWLNENGIFDDQVAITNICCYIKQHWNLEIKYLYTVEKSSLKMCDISCHGYKVPIADNKMCQLDDYN